MRRTFIPVLMSAFCAAVLFSALSLPASAAAKSAYINGAGTASEKANTLTHGFYTTNMSGSETSVSSKTTESAASAVSVPSKTESETSKPVQSTVSVHSTSHTESAVHKNSCLLESLSVSGHTLSPRFSPYTTSYAIGVSNGVNSVRVRASAQDSGASVSIRGTSNLSEGYNTVTVTVTASNGTKKAYYITVIKAKKNESVIDSAALAAYLAQHNNPSNDSGDSGNPQQNAAQAGAAATGNGGMALGQILLYIGAAICAGGTAVSTVIMRVKRL